MRKSSNLIIRTILLYLNTDIKVLFIGYGSKKQPLSNPQRQTSFEHFPLQ